MMKHKSIWRPSIDYLLIFSAAFFVYFNSLGGDFVYDDSQAIVENPDVLGKSSLSALLFNDFWGNPIASPASHKSWRPLTTLTFRWTHALVGLHAPIFHLTNVILHSIVSCLVLRLCLVCGFTSKSSLVTSLLFALHPIHTEAVANVVGRADLLQTLFVVLGLLDYVKHEKVHRIVVWTSLSILCKETGIVLPILAGVFSVLHGELKNSSLRTKIIQLAFYTGLLALGRHAINGFQTPRFSKSDNPLIYEKSPFVRVATLLWLPIFNLQLLVVPKSLCFNWSLDEAIHRIASFDDFRLIIMLIFYGLLMRFGWSLFRRISTSKPSEWDHIYISLIIMLISYLPSSNMLISVGFTVAERVLYLPSIGYCMLMSLLLQYLCNREFFRPSTDCAYGNRTITRNIDWTSGLTLYKSAIHLSPSKAWTNLGREYALLSRKDEAIAAYRETLRLTPNMADTWYNLGIVYKDSNKLTEAESCYRTAISIRNFFTQAYLNLGLLLWQLSRPTEAENMFLNCTSIDGLDTKNFRSHLWAKHSCFLQLARVQLVDHRSLNAQRTLQSVPEVVPELRVMKHNLMGQVLAALGRWVEAQEEYQQALRLQNNNLQTIVLLAQMKVAQNLTSEAQDLLRQASTHHPNSPLPPYHLSTIFKNNPRISEQYLQEALQRDPHHIPSLESLSILLRETKRYRESEKYLKILTKINNSVVSWGNYAAILHIQHRLDEAEHVYKMIIDRYPTDQNVRDNYHRLLKQKNRL